MKLNRLTPAFTLTALLAVLTASCGSEPESTQVGQARMSLATTSASGIGYRLRDAVFDITGPQDVSVLSETYPTTSGVMAVPLAAGDYSVALRDGFRMEYSTDELLTNWASIDAELVSDNPAAATIVAESETRVPFIFEVDENLVVFGGELGIEIGVRQRTARCAPHFAEQPTSAMPGCEAMGADAYVCRHDTSYPPASVCPAPMQLNNTTGLGFMSPYYTCFVEQPYSPPPPECWSNPSLPVCMPQGSPPSGCPIDPSLATCPEGFILDAEHTSLGWNPESNWGCKFSCKPSPAIAGYPCAAAGFGFSGHDGQDDNCCTRQ